MTEQYIDQYKEEIAQVHAPADLIEKTKAAVRREEKRVLRERAVRKWAYPLTAAAALLILFSVSATMKGLKKSGSGMDGAAYEESADAGAVEGEVYEESMQADGATDGAAYEESAQADAGAAEDAALEPAAGAGTSADPMDEAVSADFAAETTEEEMVMESANEAALADTAKAENAAQSPSEEMKQAQSVSRDMAQDIEDMAVEDTEAPKAGLEEKMENITIEEAEKKPAFCSLPDTETHVYHGKTFLARKEEQSWTAYVEADSGTGYVLRGEAENLEEFLKAGYEKLSQFITEK